MYAVGHLAIGYLIGKATSKLLKVEVNIPLLFVFSVIPDIDLLIPGLKHRGPTHSIIVLGLLLLPIFINYRKRSIPYFVALVLHSLISDTFVGETQLLWPFTATYYGIGIGMTSLTNILAEWIFFTASLITLFKTNDMKTLLHSHVSNLFFLIPALTVMLPPLIMFPTYIPTELTIPHITYITLFAIAIIRASKPL